MDLLSLYHINNLSAIALNYALTWMKIPSFFKGHLPT